MIKPGTDAYFIKAGYRPNLAQNTYDFEDGEAYWTPERIELGTEFQFDVYADALHRLPVNGKLLDVGSGPPQKLNRLLAGNQREVWLVDQPTTAPLANRILPYATFVGANLEEIDLDLGVRFDVIIFSDVVEHLVNPDQCLAFVQRHLKPDGVAIISTPERDVLRGPRCMESPHSMHVREWNRTEFRALLESRGFLVELQYLLPQQRLPTWKKRLGQLMNKMDIPPAWFSCQVAVCRNPPAAINDLHGK